MAEGKEAWGCSKPWDDGPKPWRSAICLIRSQHICPERAARIPNTHFKGRVQAGQGESRHHHTFLSPLCSFWPPSMCLKRIYFPFLCPLVGLGHMLLSYSYFFSLFMPTATLCYFTVWSCVEQNGGVQSQLTPNVVSRTVKMNALCCLLICIIN